MSSDELVTETATVQKGSNGNDNSKAAEEAKKLLEALRGEEGPKDGVDPAEPENANEAAREVKTPAEEKDDVEKVAEVKEDENGQERADERTGRRDDRHHDGTRPRGRGGYQSTRFKDNIKSVLTKDEESSDPVAIRKQVQEAPS